MISESTQGHLGVKMEFGWPGVEGFPLLLNSYGSGGADHPLPFFEVQQQGVYAAGCLTLISAPEEHVTENVFAIGLGDKKPEYFRAAKIATSIFAWIRRRTAPQEQPYGRAFVALHRRAVEQLYVAYDSGLFERPCERD